MARQRDNREVDDHDNDDDATVAIASTIASLLLSLLPLLGRGREAANVGVLIPYHVASSGAIRSIG